MYGKVTMTCPLPLQPASDSVNSYVHVSGLCAHANMHNYLHQPCIPLPSLKGDLSPASVGEEIFLNEVFSEVIHRQQSISASVFLLGPHSCCC